jgi:hypothetical protein
MCNIQNNELRKNAGLCILMYENIIFSWIVCLLALQKTTIVFFRKLNVIVSVHKFVYK